MKATGAGLPTLRRSWSASEGLVRGSMTSGELVSPAPLTAVVATACGAPASPSATTALAISVVRLANPICPSPGEDLLGTFPYAFGGTFASAQMMYRNEKTAKCGCFVGGPGPASTLPRP